MCNVWNSKGFLNWKLLFKKITIKFHSYLESLKYTLIKINIAFDWRNHIKWLEPCVHTDERQGENFIEIFLNYTRTTNPNDRLAWFLGPVFPFGPKMLKKICTENFPPWFRSCNVLDAVYKKLLQCERRVRIKMQWYNPSVLVCSRVRERSSVLLHIELRASPTSSWRKNVLLEWLSLHLFTLRQWI